MEENKPVDTTTAAPVQEEVKKEEVKKEEAPKANSDSEVDYKAEFEKLKKQKEQAEFTIEKLKKESKSKKVDEDDAKDDDFNVEAEVEEKARQIASSEVNKFKQEMTQDIFEAEVASIATSPEHAELIKHYYKNRIVQSGYNRAAIADDVMTAAALVDRPRIERSLREMKAKAISNLTKSNGGSSAGIPVEGTKELNLSAGDRALMQKFGISEKDLSK